MFYPIKNIPFFIKPSGGLWLSPFTPLRKFKSGWHEWCFDIWGESYESGSIITLPNNTRTYIIDSQRDLIDFIDDVGIPIESQMFSHFWKIPDFEKAAEKYDMIYLTEKGQRDTRHPWANREYNLYGWDVHGGILLNYKVRSQRPIKL
jgi:hypothetical protein